MHGLVDVFGATNRELHTRHASCLLTPRDASEPPSRRIECETRERSMTTNRRETGSFVVVSLDQMKPGVTEIQSVLESLDIPVEVVESGRRLRWNAAVVLRIPEHRMAQALLAPRVEGVAGVGGL